MRSAEAAMLCRWTMACCPQQKFDEFSADAWHDLLGDLEFPDCKEAVTAVARRQPFVAPSEIRAEVGRIRSKRWDDRLIVEPPPGLDQAGYLDWHRRYRKAVMDGTYQPQPELQLIRRPLQLEGLTKRVSET